MFNGHRISCLKRKRHVLEELPLAPPMEPRPKTANGGRIATQPENNHRLLTLFRYRPGPILTELKHKFKRYTKPATMSPR